MSDARVLTTFKLFALLGVLELTSSALGYACRGGSLGTDAKSKQDRVYAHVVLTR